MCYNSRSMHRFSKCASSAVKKDDCRSNINVLQLHVEVRCLYESLLNNHIKELESTIMMGAMVVFHPRKKRDGVSPVWWMTVSQSAMLPTCHDQDQIKFIVTTFDWREDKFAEPNINNSNVQQTK